jgi:dienelactone hydrolase
MTGRRFLQTALGVVVVVVFGGLPAGCSSSSSSPAPNRPGGLRAQVGPLTAYARTGPYAAGTFEYTVGGDKVVIWYPVLESAVGHTPAYTYHLRSWLPAALQTLVAVSFPDGVTEDAFYGLPAAAGSFPIVMFSHGFGGYPEQSSFLTSHLATWGMIVVAPDQQARDLGAVLTGKAKQVEPATDVQEQLAALTYVEQLGSTKGSLLYGRVDPSKVAALGHSAGGGTAVLLAGRDPSILGWVALAGVPVTPPARPVPSLMISGSADKTVPTSAVEKFYGKVAGHKSLLVIDDFGHNVFDDVCTVNHAHGGVTAAVRALGLPVPAAILTLATDGCMPPDLYPPMAWPMIQLAVTAQLRLDFGQLQSLATLPSVLKSAFPTLTSVYTSASG